jgi:hypothetical protein
MAEQEFKVSSQRGRFAYNRLLKTSEIPLTNCNYVLFKKCVVLIFGHFDLHKNGAVI